MCKQCVIQFTQFGKIANEFTKDRFDEAFAKDMAIPDSEEDCMVFIVAFEKSFSATMGAITDTMLEMLAEEAFLALNLADAWV